jgi:hypothetical protein
MITSTKSTRMRWARHAASTEKTNACRFLRGSQKETDHYEGIGVGERKIEWRVRDWIELA